MNAVDFIRSRHFWLKALPWLTIWLGSSFVAAGTLDWPRAWAYTLIGIITLVFNFWYVNKKNPETLKARQKLIQKNTKFFDKIFVFIFIPMGILIPIIAGLDVVRYGWAPLPFWSFPVGLLLLIAGEIPLLASMAHNPFLETTVRIQKERGHHVIKTGPYRYIRHPMYSGVFLFYPAHPLLLGSAWALVPVGVIMLAIIVRLLLEERTLKAELPGYAEYMKETRWRLIPGLW